MTHDEAKKRVADIEASQGDYEVAHGMEDQLYEDFVRFVASQEGPHRAVAKEILKTLEMTFPRYCA